MQPQDPRSPHRQQRYIACKNVGQSVLLAHSVVQVVGSNRPESGSTLTPGGGMTVLQVREAQCDSPENTVVLGHMDIQPGETAICTNDFPTYARYTGSTPAVDEHWGVASGATALSKDQTGYLILGDADTTNGTVRVRRSCEDQPYKAEAISCFDPYSHGGSGTFKILAWDDTVGDWVQFDTDIVYDPEYEVCLLPGERHWIVKVTGVGCSETRWEFLGEHGLNRSMEASATIQCDSSGSAVIWKDSGSACGIGASNCSTTVCNDWGYTRRIKSPEEIHVRFRERAWRVIPTARPQIAYANLTANLCPTDAIGSISGFQTRDWCTTENPSSADNDYGLSALSGDQVELHYDYMQDTWVIVQVKHQCYDIVADACDGEDYLQFTNSCDGQTDCCIQTKSLTKCSIATCDPSASWVDDIPLYQNSIVKSISSTGGSDPGGSANITCPTLSKVQATFCMFEQPTGQPTNLIEFQYTDVLVDLTDDGTCVIATYEAICVAGVDATQWTENVICGVDCVSGSGS